jgi:pimeloyl-ACP methyl ester carboxylesterase
MKKTLKRVGIGIGSLFAFIIVLLLGIAVFHRVSLSAEERQLTPPGHMVEVNGENMHVYIAGDNDESPLIVFLTGHGTFAPIYNFKPLYDLLTDDYRIAVVEKFGYGYSDITRASRDIDTVLSEVRTALHSLGETGPFILSPHSMSGVLALRWAQVYPDEIKGIFAIDVGLPDMYINGHIDGTSSLRVFGVLTWIGLQRALPSIIPNFIYAYPAREYFLTSEEHVQHRLLINRNAVNRTVIAESVLTVPNAQTVVDAGLPDVPMLMLVSVPFGERNEWFIPYSETFAQEIGARIVFFEDADHFIHQYEPERVADLLRGFIIELAN